MPDQTSKQHERTGSDAPSTKGNKPVRSSRPGLEHVSLGPVQGELARRLVVRVQQRTSARANRRGVRPEHP